MIDGHVSLSGTYTQKKLMEYCRVAEEQGLDGITILEPTHLFIECKQMYREVCATYSYQKQWFHDQCKYSIIEYQKFITDMKQKSFPIQVKFGLEVCYFTQHEAFIRQLKTAYHYDEFIGAINFIDNLAFHWQQSYEMLWNKYNAGFLYRRYYEMMNAMLTSDLFDGIAGFDSIKALQVPCTFNMTHTYQKMASLIMKEHMYVENDMQLRYRFHHPDNGLAPAFLDICRKYHIPVIQVSNAICSKDIGKGFL